MTERIYRVPLDDKEFVAINRVVFEISSARNLIDMYVSICKKHNTQNMLDAYIGRYDHALKTAVMHKEMLSSEIMEKYFPYHEGFEKEHTVYNIDITGGVIEYRYAQEKTG